jgi:hypothetical protein
MDILKHLRDRNSMEFAVDFTLSLWLTLPIDAVLAEIGVLA